MSIKSVHARNGAIRPPVTRATSWWLDALKRRATPMYDEHIRWSQPVAFSWERLYAQGHVSAISIDAAEAAIDRDPVSVTASS